MISLPTAIAPVKPDLPSTNSSETQSSYDHVVTGPNQTLVSEMKDTPVPLPKPRPVGPPEPAILSSLGPMASFLRPSSRPTKNTTSA
ncbi:hypothetical protein FRC03_004352 [Tulasnella sp. 419]|nr:hypothetical protein FRC03_004352 [Tulasnella sp. 419]